MKRYRLGLNLSAAARFVPFDAGLRPSRRNTLVTVPLVVALALLAGCTTLRSKQEARNAPPPPPPPALGNLAPADVQTAFGTGASFTESVVGGTSYVVVFGTDGTAKRTPMGSKTAESGTWRAAAPGYCAKWGKIAEQCYTVSRTTTTTYDLLDAKGKVIAHLSA